MTNSTCGEINQAAVQAFQPTSELRWLRPAETTTKPDRLQRAWRDISTGQLVWEDVPLVIAPPAGATP